MHSLQDIWMFTVLIIVVAKVVNCEIVNTRLGRVRGKLLKYEDYYYYSYKGIPYAEPPKGNLRFRPPVPKAPWTEILNATQEGAVCPQSEATYTQQQMSEDCLFLNIYVPANCSDQLPVLFWVHGGEFNSNSGNEDSFGPQLLMKYGIVLVTMNYRLGALGFLSLDIEGANGNAGLKDVVLALKWTKENIDYFGGDANKITIGGQSAGSTIAHYLMLTTTTCDLFKRAILHSGSAIGFRFFSPDPSANAFLLGSTLGINTENKAELLESLIHVNVFDLVKATDKMGENDDRKGFRPFRPFVPNAEIESDHAFITEQPLEIIKRGITQNYPVLAGFNEDEGIKMIPAVKQNSKLIDELNENFERCIPSDIAYEPGSVKSRSLAEDIKQYYFAGKNISENNADKFVKLITDTQFSHSIDYWIRMHKAQRNSEQVFYYKFKYDGELNWFKISNNIELPGTAHGDELGYIFHTKNTAQLIPHINGTTRQMLINMLKSTTNFVKTGSPNIDYTVWIPTNLPHINYYKFESTSSNSFTAPIRTRTKFWRDIYNEYYEYITRSST